jgi:hypothetical protein
MGDGAFLGGVDETDEMDGFTAAGAEGAAVGF